MFADNDTDKCNYEDYVPVASKNKKDIYVQLVLSLALGASALIGFCVCLR